MDDALTSGRLCAACPGGRGDCPKAKPGPPTKSVGAAPRATGGISQENVKMGRRKTTHLAGRAEPWDTRASLTARKGAQPSRGLAQGRWERRPRGAGDGGDRRARGWPHGNSEGTDFVSGAPSACFVPNTV